MKNPTVRTKFCIALIADMVRSRELSRVQRPRVQERFKDFVGYLNRAYSRNILSRFVITLGDEFQGLLSSASPIPDLMWDIEHRFSARNLRVGIGLGVLSGATRPCFNLRKVILGNLQRAKNEELLSTTRFKIPSRAAHGGTCALTLVSSYGPVDNRCFQLGGPGVKG